MISQKTTTRYDQLGVDLSDLEPMARTTLDTIGGHASCRTFRPDPLPPGTVERLAVAAQSASTSSNLQAYSIVAVEDAARKDQLATLSGNQQMVRDCPLFFVFCPDIHRLHYLSQRQGREFGATYLEMFLLACVDAALAAQNVAVAAEAMGMGICMCGAIRNNPQEVIDLLALPRGVFALAGMCVGYPAAPSAVKARLPLPAVLHREQYSDDQLEDSLVDYDRTMIESGIYAGRQVSVSDNTPNGKALEYGWAEHTARRISKPDTIAASTGLRENLRAVLEAHGWHFD